MTVSATMEQKAAYEESLINHIENVREAGLRIGVRKSLLYIHDASKWDKEEFDPYARYFFTATGEQREDTSTNTRADSYSFNQAWLHHLHHNPHHWQHWMMPDGFTYGNMESANGCLVMPGHYIKEMLADWMGASKTYTGSWNMKDWLEKNFKNVKLEKVSEVYLLHLLESIGYELE